MDRRAPRQRPSAAASCVSVTMTINSIPVTNAVKTLLQRLIAIWLSSSTRRTGAFRGDLKHANTQTRKHDVPSVYPLERLGVLHRRHDALLSLQRVLNEPLRHPDGIQLAVRRRLVRQ